MVYVWKEFKSINITNDNKLDTLEIHLVGDGVVERKAILTCAIDGQAGVLESVGTWDRDRCVEYAEMYAEANGWKESMLKEDTNTLRF